MSAASNLEQARTVMRNIAQKATQTLNNPDLTPAQKKAVLDDLEPQLKSATDEIETLQRFQATHYGPSAASDSGIGDLGGSLGTSSMTMTQLPTIGAAPPLRLSGSDAAQLFVKGAARESYATKATVGAAAVPQSVVPMQGLSVAQTREPTRLLSLMPVAATDAPVMEWYQAVGTSAAAAVAQGAAKPESSFAYLKRSSKVFKVAHWIEVEDEVFEDFPSFASLLNDDMVGGVIEAENRELLLGTGVDPRPTGLMNTTGILTRAHRAGTGSDATDRHLDTLEMATTDLRVGERFVGATAVVLNPLTYSRIRRGKNTDGTYTVGDPTAAGPPNLWGVPVVLTTTMPATEALVANLAEAAAVYVRKTLVVDTGVGETQFKQNKRLVRAEERLLLAVPKPACLVRVTGLTQATA